MKSQFLRIFLLFSILFVLLARFQVSLVRFFDPDEFAHLHWAWLMATGKLPYADFFFYATPLYQWFLWPLFQLPPSDRILLLARVWEFVLYLLNAFIIFRITRRITKNESTSLLSLLIFTTFSMTFDKTIDIRPDMLMTFFYFLSVERILSWPAMTAKRVLVVGLLLGTSLLVFFKIIYAIPAVFLLLFIRSHPAGRGETLIRFWAGFIFPLGLFFLYLFINNIHLLAWTAFSHTQFVVNQSKEAFSLIKTLSPWPLVYVAKGGVSFPWLVNIGIWIAALFGIGVLWQQQKRFAVFSLFFALSAFVFLALFPAPYVQYFIPLSAVASILAAIGCWEFVFRIRVIKKIPSQIPNTIPQILLSCILLISFFLQYRERVMPTSNNAEQLRVIRDVLSISKPMDTFYDMVGSYVFRPDGFFVCCHPYAEFVDKLKTKPPSLSQSLLSNNTQFLILDRTGQSLWKPKKEDLEYLVAHFKPSQYHKIYIRQ